MKATDSTASCKISMLQQRYGGFSVEEEQIICSLFCAVPRPAPSNQVIHRASPQDMVIYALADPFELASGA